MQKSLLTPLIIILTAAAIGGMALYGGGGKQEASTSGTAQAGLRQADLGIEGLFCIGCSASVEGAVSQTPGVISVSVSGQSGTVVYDPSLTSTDAILANTIFQVYPARLLSDEPHSGDAELVGSTTDQLPDSLQEKLTEVSLLLQQKQEAGDDIQVYADAYAQLDQRIQGGKYSSAEVILDTMLLQLRDE